MQDNSKIETEELNHPEHVGWNTVNIAGDAVNKHPHDLLQKMLFGDESAVKLPSGEEIKTEIRSRRSPLKWLTTN